MLKIAIIGCGGIGTYHLGHLLQFTDFSKIVGVCDLISERAENFSAKTGAPAYTDYKVMYDETKPDCVFICVPPYCHGEIEYETIRRGIHFFVEKPVALDLDLAKDIREKVEKAGLVTAVGFQCRYSALVDPLNEFIASHPLCYVDCVRVGGVPGVDWWRNKNISGGQIVEQTIHNFDLVRWHFGDPEAVFTYGARGYVNDVPNYNTDDVSVTAIRFKNGGIGQISTGCYAKSGEAFDGKITFSARDSRAELYILGKLSIFGVKPQEVTSSEDTEVIKGDGNLARSEGGAIIYTEKGDAGVPCDRTFLKAVEAGDRHMVRADYNEAVKTLAFVLACNKSMATGKEVVIDYD
ncbi:MAG: Gfo/Idh/MocA family oxidoreductase [Clostridia bacterium]|nr:Gfo/Idh/MocA family oxidoreductase [Clostridia bacterium]